MKRSRSPEETTGPSPSVITSESPETWSSGSSEADLLEQPAAKIVELDPAILAQSRAGAGSRSSREDNLSIMKCSMPPHKEGLTFSSYAEYENHYLKAHTNRCVECGKNFPSEHLLNVHIEEFHDSFVAVKRERGEHTVGGSSVNRRSLHHTGSSFK